MWCIKEIDEEYRNKMYQILKLYSEDYNPKYPLIYLDEKHKPSIGNIKSRIPMKPWSPKKYDYPYNRNWNREYFCCS
jgi:hypothetical protein